jgi:hypothetical protein
MRVSRINIQGPAQALGVRRLSLHDPCRGRSRTLRFNPKLQSELIALSTPRQEQAMGLILIIILVIFLMGGFSGRFGGYGYGYGHGGMGIIGIVLVVLLILLLMGRL